LAHRSCLNKSKLTFQQERAIGRGFAENLLKRGRRPKVI
jgi:hypothetical protein